MPEREPATAQDTASAESTWIGWQEAELERLGAGLLEEHWRARDGPEHPQDFPLAPEVRQRLHDIHRPEAPRRLPSSRQISGTAEGLGTEPRRGFGFQLLGKRCSDQSAQHVSAPAGRQARISRDDREDRWLGGCDDTGYTFQEDSGPGYLGRPHRCSPGIQFAHRGKLGEESPKLARMRSEDHAFL